MKIWERGKKHGDDPNVENNVGQVKSISKCSSFPFKAFQQILHFLPSLEIEAKLFIIFVHTLRLWSGAGDKGADKNLLWNLFNWSHFHFIIYHLSI